MSSEIGVLSNLDVFSIHTTLISGALPSTLGQLSQLITILLFDTRLSGTLPRELGLLSDNLHWPNLRVHSVRVV